MSNNDRKHLGEADATAEGKVPEEQRQEEYEGPETVRVGSAKEVTQGNSTNRLDGYYGPGWTRWW